MGQKALSVFSLPELIFLIQCAPDGLDHYIKSVYLMLLVMEDVVHPSGEHQGAEGFPRALSIIR